MVDKTMLESVRNFGIPELRKSIKTCDENTPANAAYAMMTLTAAYKGDTAKMTKDPLFHEFDTLIREFSDTCACNKFGRKRWSNPSKRVLQVKYA